MSFEAEAALIDLAWVVGSSIIGLEWSVANLRRGGGETTPMDYIGLTISIRLALATARERKNMCRSENIVIGF